MKGLMKASYSGSDMWRGWRGIGSSRESKSVGNRLVDRPMKRWLDTLKECLRKRSLDVRQTKRMVQDKSE